MKFGNLKAGDTVYVVPQQSRYGSARTPHTATVSRVGRGYGYIAKSTGEMKFHLDTGESYDKDGLSRANGFGFDVYATEQEYKQEADDWYQYQRLKARLGAGSSMIKLSADAVRKIHAILDEDTQ